MVSSTGGARILSDLFHYGLGYFGLNMSKSLEF